MIESGTRTTSVWPNSGTYVMPDASSEMSRSGSVVAAASATAAAVDGALAATTEWSDDADLRSVGRAGAAGVAAAASGEELSA
jgi:hypothetical protein